MEYLKIISYVFSFLFVFFFLVSQDWKKFPWYFSIVCNQFTPRHCYLINFSIILCISAFINIHPHNFTLSLHLLHPRCKNSFSPWKERSPRLILRKPVWYISFFVNENKQIANPLEEKKKKKKKFRTSRFRRDSFFYFMLSNFFPLSLSLY